MIPGISSSFIQKTNRLPIQGHKLTLEPQVADTSNILITQTPVIDEEYRDGGSGIPQSTGKRDLKDLVNARDGLGNFYGLRGRQFRRGGEV